MLEDFENSQWRQLEVWDSVWEPRLNWDKSAPNLGRSSFFIQWTTVKGRDTWVDKVPWEHWVPNFKGNVFVTAYSPWQSLGKRITKQMEDGKRVVKCCLPDMTLGLLPWTPASSASLHKTCRRSILSKSLHRQGRCFPPPPSFTGDLLTFKSSWGRVNPSSLMVWP